ncbi:MAG: hypothetical protein ABRQ27_05825 [Clostridiaceae bacterium]
MTLIYKKCPNCGSNNTVKLVHGLSRGQKIERHENDVDDGNPEYCCGDCNFKWSRQDIIDHAYKKISSIKAFVGGFFGASYEIELDLKNNLLIWNGREEGVQESLSKALRLEENKWILEELKAINLLEWKAKYIEPYVCDGTQWRVDIETPNKTIHKYGSNKYPREWEAFCRIIEYLSQRNFQ